MTERADQPLSGLKVLVAEDELMVAMLLEDMLADLAAEVVGPVSSLDEAMRAIEDGNVQLATLDVNLGGEEAYPAATALRERDIPFVFVSAYGELPKCPPELADAPRLKKPFRLTELAAALDEALRRAAG